MLSAMVFRSSNTDFYPDLTIPVIDSTPDQLLFVHNITGLEPPDATVNSRGFGSLDGEFYVGTHVGKRNIVVTLGLNSSSGYASVSAARSKLYGYAMPKMLVLLRFLSTDHIPVDITGYVESWEPNRFSQDPEIQISIICPKPNFESTEEKVFVGRANDDPLDTVVSYNGNLTTGIYLTMNTRNTEAIESLRVEIGIDPGAYRRFEIEEIDSSWPDDVFVMDSRINRKFVELRPATEDRDKVNLLGFVTDESLWPYLQPAANLVRVRTLHLDDDLDWTLTFTEQFAGI